MLAHLADVSIRSLLIALPALLIGHRRKAALQHAVWTAVVCGMLALFVFGPVLPRLPLPMLRAPAAAVRAVPPALVPDVTRSIPDESPIPGAVAARNTSAIRGSGVALCGYAAVAFALLVRLVTGMFLIRRLSATGKQVRTLTPGGSADALNRELKNGLYESEFITVPFTIGWLRPRILLPMEWRDWDRDKLHAVLAHEGAHVRRRDGLVGLLAGLNKCIFWFHPLAWILERRLALLAEQACDESSVATLGNRERYASLLLEMTLVVDGSERRLRHHALTMAAGSHIRQRIESLLEEGRTFSRGMSRAAWATVILCAVPLVWGAGAVEVERQAPRLEMPQWTRIEPPQGDGQVGNPPHLAQVISPQAAPVAARPKFDVASVRPCKTGDDVSSSGGRAGRGAKSAGGVRGGYLGRSPGRLWITCMSVRQIVDIAYGQFGSDRLTNDSNGPFDEQRIRGGAGWVHSDRYTINAESEDPAAKGPTEGFNSRAFKLMAGPMLRALLEDRFQLQIHREVEDVPMYALTVAKSGLKLKPMQEGDCLSDGPPEWVKGGKPPCRWMGWGVNGPNRTILGGGVPLSQLSELLGDLIMDRHVIDRTGVTEFFNIRMEFAPDENTPAKMISGREPVDPSSDIPLGTSIFTALTQQLGLKLESIKAPRGFIVIDRVEQPSEN